MIKKLGSARRSSSFVKNISGKVEKVLQNWVHEKLKSTFRNGKVLSVLYINFNAKASSKNVMLGGSTCSCEK